MEKSNVQNVNMNSSSNKKCPCCGGTEFEAGLILDPFCGSGTALIVAKKLGRNYIGIELNSSYVAIANKRLAMQARPLI